MNSQPKILSCLLLHELKLINKISSKNNIMKTKT